MAPFGLRRRHRLAVTASAVHVDARRGKKKSGGRGADTVWQDRAWLLHDELGEIHYAADFFGKSLAKLRLLVEQRNKDGEWEEVKDGEPVKALDRIRGPEGGREALQGQYGRLSFMVGEMYLFVSRRPDAEAEQWEILSVEEITVPKDGEGYERRARTSGAEPEKYTQPEDGADLQPGEAQAYRLWTPHPRRSAEADSAMRAVLDPCEELQILSRAVRGRARSRAAGAGLLLIPESVSPSPPMTTGDEDPAEDPFMIDLAEALVTPIGDEESAAAVVPFLIRGPEDALDRIRHVPLSADAEHGYPEQTLRTELVHRIAQGLDLPVEILLGFADSNHWSGWLIDDQTWGAHLQPKAEALCSDLTAVYLRQALGDDGEKYRVWYDASAIINRPDRSRDAKDLHDRGELSGKALREAGGFEETDAPDDAERKVWVGIQLGDVGLATGGEPTPAPAAPPPAQDVEPGEGPADTEKAPPQAEAARLLGAAEAAFWRCRQAAGSKLLTRLQKEPELRAVVRGAETGDVAHVLGRDELDRLRLDPETLVAGGAECLTSTAAGGGGSLLRAAVERWAAETLAEAAADLTNGSAVRPPLEIRTLATRLARRR